ncbi:MAG: GNAT family N-acetyltransferase [Clostridiaceae bacterium]|jgi:RimJ/RimL family protein N-acetyltransferase|nr:GNAT family N-acetyltransferase [Clostridiaceae bacterium]
MIELHNEDFYLVKDLIERKNKFRPEAIAVVDGNNPGWIFVDSKDNPITALIWCKGMEGFHLIGDCENNTFISGLNSFIDGYLVQRLKDVGFNDFEVSGDPGWEQTIEDVFSSRGLCVGKQIVYTFKKSDFNINQVSHVPQGFYLQSISNVLEKSKEYENIEFLLNIIESFWGTKTNFLSKGVGYCITTDKWIVSTAYTGFIAGSTYTIGIETVKDYRRRGFAELVAQEVKKAHMNLGANSYWDCMKDNVASYNLAEKLGFIKEYEYNVYWFSLNSKN